MNENSSKEDFIFREKRKYPRVDLIFNIEYEFIKEFSNEQSHAHIGIGKDISVGGISFDCTNDTNIKEGDILFIKFFIQELEGNLKAIGKVIRIWYEENKKFCAIKFTGIDPIDYEILNNFIQEFRKLHNL